MVDRAALERLVLSCGLPDGPWAGDGATRLAVAAPQGPLTGAVVDDVLAWAINERLDGPAWSVLTPLLADDDELRCVLLDEHLAGLRATVAAEATAVWAVEVLERTGVGGWLLKGLASAHLDYHDPSLRTSYDADVLVSRADLGAAVEALIEAGCSRVAPPIRPAWERRYARAVVLVSPDGVEIDLHAAVVDGYFGVTLDHDRLCRDSVEVVLGGRPCRMLSSPGRLVATSYALVLGRGPRARLIRDLAHLVATCEVDVDAAREMAGNGSIVLDEALWRVGDALGITVVDRRPIPPGTPGDQLRRAITATGWSHDARGAFVALRGLDRAVYAFGIVCPTRAHLESRQLTRLGHGRQLGSIRRRRP